MKLAVALGFAACLVLAGTASGQQVFSLGTAVKIGVSTDMSGPYSDIGGAGSVLEDRETEDLQREHDSALADPAEPRWLNHSSAPSRPQQWRPRPTRCLRAQQDLPTSSWHAYQSQSWSTSSCTWTTKA